MDAPEFMLMCALLCVPLSVGMSAYPAYPCVCNHAFKDEQGV